MVEQERVAKILEQKEKGDLTFMKTQSMISAATAAVELSAANAGTLSYGDRVQVQHDGMWHAAGGGWWCLHEAQGVPSLHLPTRAHHTLTWRLVLWLVIGMMLTLYIVVVGGAYSIRRCVVHIGR